MSKTVLDLLHSLGVEDLISGEFVSKYTVFLTKAASELWWIIHTRTYVRVCYFIWSFVFLYSQKIGGDFTVRSLRSRGGEIPAFASRD